MFLAWARSKLTWRGGALAAGGLAVVALYAWRLGSLTPGLSPDELAAGSASSNLKEIWLQPLDGPHKLLQFLTTRAGNSPFALRLASVLLGLLFAGCLIYLIRTWFGIRAAVFSLFVTIGTPWLILAGRSGDSTISWLWPLAIVAAAVWLAGSQHHPGWALLAFYLSLAAALFTPGLIWFLLAGLIFGFNPLLHLLKRGRWWQHLIGLVVLLAALVPLVGGLIFGQPRLIDWLGLPQYWPTPLEFLKTVGQAAQGLVWRTPGDVAFVIDHQAIFNGVQLVLALIGLASLWLKRQFKYIGWLLGWLVLTLVLVGLNRDLGWLTIGLPVVAGLAAAGLYYLWAQWRRVFPRNPLAKGLAYIMIGLLLGLQLAYVTRYCLVAWPHSPAIHNSYVLK